MKVENTGWAGTYSSMPILGSATKSYTYIYIYIYIYIYMHIL